MFTSFPRFLLRQMRRPLLGMFTGSGYALLIAMAACTYSLWGLPLEWLFIAFGSLLMLAFVVNRFSLPALEVTLRLPSTATVDCAVTGHIQIVNRSSRVARSLGVALPRTARPWKVMESPLHVGTLMPGESTTVSLKVRVARRGSYPWPDMQIVSTFPFGLMRVSRGIVAADPLAVAPRPTEQSHRLTANFVAAALGQTASQRRGPTQEYLGSREYLPGMPVVRWDYASWSRLGRPVVREFAEEHAVSFIVLLDLFSMELSGRNLNRHLEASLCNARSLCEKLRQAGHTVQLIFPEPDGDSVHWSAAKNYPRQLVALANAESLRRRDPRAEWECVARQSVSRGAQSLIVMLSQDAPRQNLIRGALGPRALLLNPRILAGPIAEHAA